MSFRTFLKTAFGPRTPVVASRENESNAPPNQTQIAAAQNALREIVRTIPSKSARRGRFAESTSLESSRSPAASAAHPKRTTKESKKSGAGSVTSPRLPLGRAQGPHDKTMKASRARAATLSLVEDFRQADKLRSEINSVLSKAQKIPDEESLKNTLRRALTDINLLPASMQSEFYARVKDIFTGEEYKKPKSTSQNRMPPISRTPSIGLSSSSYASMSIDSETEPVDDELGADELDRAGRDAGIPRALARVKQIETSCRYALESADTLLKKHSAKDVRDLISAARTAIKSPVGSKKFKDGLDAATKLVEINREFSSVAQNLEIQNFRLHSFPKHLFSDVELAQFDALYNGGGNKIYKLQDILQYIENQVSLQDGSSSKKLYPVDSLKPSEKESAVKMAGQLSMEIDDAYAALMNHPAWSHRNIRNEALRFSQAVQSSLSTRRDLVELGMPRSAAAELMRHDDTKSLGSRTRVWGTKA